MKNLPYFKGGYCEKPKNHLSFNGKFNVLQFTDFEDFVNRADEIIYTYMKYKNEIDLMAYKDYIYSKKLNDNPAWDNAIKDKCFEWIISYEYEDITINDLYSLLGVIKKGLK
jgi:hypothetical protein